MLKKSRTEYSLLNIIAGLGGYVANTVLGFICRMVFVRCLSESYLGINGFLTNFLSMLSLAELGIGSAIIYALYKPIAENDEEKISALMHVYRIAYYIIGIIVAVAGICMMPLLGIIVGDTSGIKESIYLIYGIYLFNTASSYFFSYQGSLITAFQRNYIVVGTSYVITCLQSVFQIIFLLIFNSYMPYLVIQTIGTQAYNIIITVWTHKDYPYISNKNVTPLSKVEKKHLFKNIKSVTVYKLSGILVNNTDNLVLTYFNGLGITGLASNYTLLTNTLDTLVKQVFNAVTASVGNLNASDSKEKQYSFFKALNLANFWLYGWAAIGVAFVSSDLVKLLFGDTYVMSPEIPFILAVNLYMVGMQNAIWTYKNTKGMFKYGQYILLVTATLNVIGDIIFGLLFGVFGIYFATAIARLVTNTWYEPYVVFKFAFGLNPVIYLKKYLQYLFILILSGLCCDILCAAITTHIIISVIAKLFICSIIPNLFFFIAFHKTEEMHYIVNIVRRIKNFIINRIKRK